MSELAGRVGALLRHRLVQTALGLAVGIALLWLAFARTDVEGLSRRLAQVQPLWLLLALVNYGVALGIRSWRWQIILAPVRRLSFLQVYHSLVVGYAANNVLPARLGELLRADYLGRRYGISRLSVIGTIVVERLFDVIVFVGFIIAGIAALHGRPDARVPPILHAAEVVAGGCVLLGIGLFAILRLRHRPLPAPFSFLESKIRSLAKGLHLVTGLRELALLAATTVIVWTADSTSTWLLCRALGVNPGLSELLLIMGMSCLAALIPAAPANIGALQYALVLAFQLLGYDADAGFGLALLIQGCFVGSSTLAGGLLYLMSTLTGAGARASKRSASTGSS